jgi:hypothetical protein
MKHELLKWLDAQRKHVAEQVGAMPAAARRRSHVPSGWTPRGVIRHLTLDVERVWFRAVLAGERLDLPEGYEGWTAPEDQSDEDLLEQYVVPPESWRASLCGFPVGGRGVLVVDRAHHARRAVPALMVVEAVAPVQHDRLSLAGVGELVA